MCVLCTKSTQYVESKKIQVIKSLQFKHELWSICKSIMW